MSNNKNRLAKKRMLEQMKKEIEGLEHNIKNSKTTNLKIAMLKRMKLSLLTCRLVAPYILTAGITFGLFSIFGETPFIMDDEKKILETKKDMDSHGNIKYEQQYDEYSNTQGTICYFGKWEKSNDNLYTREIKKYAIGSVSEEDLMNILDANDVSSLAYYFGKPIAFKYESRNNLTDEEIHDDPYLETTVYSKNENDYIVVKESVGNNVGFTILWLIFTMFSEIIPNQIREQFSSFDYGLYRDKIKKEYKPVDVDVLAQKLEIKRSNYNRLTR